MRLSVEGLGEQTQRLVAFQGWVNPDRSLASRAAGRGSAAL